MMLWVSANIVVGCMLIPPLWWWRFLVVAPFSRDARRFLFDEGVFVGLLVTGVMLIVTVAAFLAVNLLTRKIWGGHVTGFFWWTAAALTFAPSGVTWVLDVLDVDWWPF